MELVQGESILRYVRPEAKVHLDRLRESFGALLAVTNFLHRFRVIHRDLKPGNILVNHSGRLVVLDFGLALHLRPGSDSGTGVLGTPAYMAPEQVSDGKITEAIDWYAVGVTLYQALTGRFPFEGSIPEVFVYKATSDPSAPAELAPDTPGEWNDLCMSLLSRDPAVRVDASRQFLTSGGQQLVFPTATTAVVGREEVLDVLFNACSRILAGTTSVIELRGPSGYGKTRILDAFAGAVADRFPAALIIRARCYEHESVPFKAADEMMDQLSRELRRLGEGADPFIPEDFDLLARLFPVFELLKTPRMNAAHDTVVTAIANPQEVRRRAFLALAELLQKLSAARILVICLDDLHWGDADCAALFDKLLHAQPAIPFVLVASYRSDTVLSPFLGSWRNNLAPYDGHLQIQQIEIGPLPPEAARTCALAMLGNTVEVSRDIIDALVEESRGEPLLLEQLVANYKRGGVQKSHDMHQILEETVSRLSAPARGVLCTLAAAGEPLPESMILRLADGEVDGSRTLASLIDERLVRRREVSGGTELEIYHDRIRSALIQQLSENRLRALHLQIANGLVEIGFPDAGVIAMHVAKSDDSLQAVAYALKGATQAEAVFAFDRAARLYQVALELGGQNRREESELYERMGDAYACANRLIDAVNAYLEAARRVVTATEIKA